LRGSGRGLAQQIDGHHEVHNTVNNNIKKALVTHLGTILNFDFSTYMTDAVSMYEKKARDIWLFDYPAQVSLCGTQVNLRFSV